MNGTLPLPSKFIEYYSKYTYQELADLTTEMAREGWHLATLDEVQRLSAWPAGTIRASHNTWFTPTRAPKFWTRVHPMVLWPLASQANVSLNVDSFVRFEGQTAPTWAEEYYSTYENDAEMRNHFVKAGAALGLRPLRLQEAQERHSANLPTLRTLVSYDTDSPSYHWISTISSNIPGFGHRIRFVPLEVTEREALLQVIPQVPLDAEAVEHARQMRFFFGFDPRTKKTNVTANAEQTRLSIPDSPWSKYEVDD